MLNFCWKFLTPLALILLIVIAILDKALTGASTLTYTLSILAANVVVAWITIVVLRKYAGTKRQRVAEAGPVAVPPAVALEESVGQE
jgi:hypothetical protein